MSKPIIPERETPEACAKRWSDSFQILVGRKITNIRYLTKEESNELDWHGERAIVFTLDDGTILFPSRDDEGNGAGALFICPEPKGKCPETAPVIYG
jgi:hypothetical protein